MHYTCFMSLHSSCSFSTNFLYIPLWSDFIFFLINWLYGIKMWSIWRETPWNTEGNVYDMEFSREVCEGDLIYRTEQFWSFFVDLLFGRPITDKSGQLKPSTVIAYGPVILCLVVFMKLSVPLLIFSWWTIPFVKMEYPSYV